jgi:hypothetical protein
MNPVSVSARARAIAQPTSAIRRAVIAACGAMLFGLAAPSSAQKSYPSPEQASAALVEAVATHDEPALKAVLGAGYARLMPVSTVSGDDVTAFLAAWAKRHGIEHRDDKTAFLEIGESQWQLPIPIVRTASGWAFDPRQTNEELRTRRIGRNELAAMRAALAYADAQEDYFDADPDGDGVKAFAARLISTRGKRDGLYWPALADEPQSPLGPMVGLAAIDKPYHGYLFRVLTEQGPGAPGGAKSYIHGGRMSGGFALVAWPARYGDTGVMTFIVSRDAVVYEKDLGPQTASIARAMKAYEPDATWKKADAND